MSILLYEGKTHFFQSDIYSFLLRSISLFDYRIVGSLMHQILKSKNVTAVFSPIFVYLTCILKEFPMCPIWDSSLFRSVKAGVVQADMKFDEHFCSLQYVLDWEQSLKCKCWFLFALVSFFIGYSSGYMIEVHIASWSE